MSGAHFVGTGRAVARSIAMCLLVLDAGQAAQPRVVLVDIDGVRRDTFEKAYLSGGMPNLERLLGQVREGKGFGSSLWFENATAVFPAITMAGQASLFTGAPPSRHGVPGNRWFERSTGRVIDYFSSTGTPCVYGILAISVLECGGGLANRHLQAPTLYEAATAAGKTSTVVFSQFWRGATRALLPGVGDGASLLRGNAVSDYERFDVTMMDRALGSLRKDGVPDLLTVYFIGADGVGHKAGTRGQAAYLRRVFDVQMGRLLDQLDSQDPGWRKHTQFILTSDHGRSDTKPSPSDASLGAAIGRALGRAGYAESQYRVVDNGGVVHIYLRSKRAGAAWKEQPPAAEVDAAARALAGDESLRSAVELVAHRPDGPGGGYAVSRPGHPDTGRISAMLAAFESPRCGDMLLLLKEGRYFGNTDGEGAQHGSIFANDLSIPLVIAGGGVTPGRSPAAISTPDVARIIAAYLGFSLETSGATMTLRKPKE